MTAIKLIKYRKFSFIFFSIWMIYMSTNLWSSIHKKQRKERTFQDPETRNHTMISKLEKFETEKLFKLERSPKMTVKLVFDRKEKLPKHSLKHIKRLIFETEKSYAAPCNESSQLLGVRGTSKYIFDVIKDPPTFQQTIQNNPNILTGGRYSPKNCKAKYKVAIIIPFRGRELQLQGLLAHMHPIWQRQMIDYTVYTASEAGDGRFNKGKLMNAGFLEASKDRAYDCYAFHDVDLLVDNDQCLYWCPPDKERVLHFPYLIDKFGFRDLRYEPRCLPDNFRRGPIGYFGGVTMFTAEQFRDINGFSNLFWGWGGEDDDAQLRVKRKGYIIRRNAKCQYRMFRHGRDKGNELNQVVGRLLNIAFEKQDNEGLNTLKYKLISKNLMPLYTNLTIDVGSPHPEMKELFSDPNQYQSCNGTAFLDPKFW